jgi:hypothetical protein
MEALDNTIVEEQATKEIEKAINTDQRLRKRLIPTRTPFLIHP